MSRVLVTGASGFIGTHLRGRLVQDGVNVHAISRLPRTDDAITWWQADVSDGAAVADVVARARPELIFHLAGYPRGTRDLDAVLPAVRDSLVGSVNVLVEATRRGTPVVVAGSMEEPDAVVEPIPASPYAAAKHAVGAYARMLHALHGLDVLVLRIFMVYGPAHEDYGKLLPYVITSLLKGEPPKISSGSRLVDWIYVDDVVEAFVAASKHPEAFSAQTLDIGSGALTTLRDTVEVVAELVGGGVQPQFGAVPDRPLEVVRVAEVERAAELLAWRARTSLPSGLRSTIEWYRHDLERALRLSKATS